MSFVSEMELKPINIGVLEVPTETWLGIAEKIMRTLWGG